MREIDSAIQRNFIRNIQNFSGIYRKCIKRRKGSMINSGKRIYKRIVVMLMILSMVMMGAVSTYASDKSLNSCSRYITVDGKKMHIVFYGGINENTKEFADPENTTLVMLPALGVSSPNIYFKPIAESISSDFNVVVIEPFGYGLSDMTSSKRTVENINAEVNETLDTLGINEVVLLVHSISGVYGLNFVYDYPEKVKGFVAVDNTIFDEGLSEEMEMEQRYMLQEAQKFNELRNSFSSVEDFQKAILENPEKYGATLPDVKGYHYTEEDKQEYIHAFSRSSNETIIDEICQMDEALITIKDQKFPDNLPVLTMISKDNVDAMPAWETGHRKQLNLQTGKHDMFILEGSHYIWYTNLSEVVKHIYEWKDKNYL